MKFEVFTPTVIHELGQRNNQEDSVFPAKGAAADTDRLFLVCDGMGGHAKGEVASANVIDAMTAWIKQRTLPNGVVTDSIIEGALQSAHQRLNTLDDGSDNKMGTTLTMVCLHSGGVAMAHVGDSRIYHIRPSHRKILYKSIDHSLVYDLYRAGAIKYEEMATSPQRNVITRAVMPGEQNYDKVDIAHTTNVLPGDYFYLCSDGMLEEMTDEQLVEVLCSETSDVMKAATLVSMTQGNKDNHTALLIKIKNVIAEPGDEKLPNDEHVSAYNEVVVPLKAGNTMAPAPNQPTPPPYVAPAPQAAASAVNNTAPRSDGDKKGVNKLLLLLVILLFAIVVGCTVYFLTNRDQGSSDEESSEASTEMVVSNDEEVVVGETDKEDVRRDENRARRQTNNKTQQPKLPVRNDRNNKDVQTKQKEEPQPQKQQPQSQEETPKKDGKSLNLNERLNKGQKTGAQPETKKDQPSNDGTLVKKIKKQ